MGVAVLHSHDVLKGPFSRNPLFPHGKYPRNPKACPNKQTKPQPNNRRRRSPPRPLAGSPPPAAHPLPPHVVNGVVPKGLKKKIHNNNNNNNNSNHLVVGQIRILKRGEVVAKTVTDLAVEDSDLGTTRRIGPDPENVPTQIRLSDAKSIPASFYAGSVTLTSPPPSDVPLPAFTKKSVSMFKAGDATNDLIRILRLEI
ncbi:PREDICTED: uncharacterized SDCCAG3 family protein-like [Tarenaya hassleriana]|uniref:uncharacterized SDCCAG3 family protein-like n=1 Tax=Tarenaya hassleriana TaxID=28532 RepID=UPI00053C11E4|nr:PREDICTED: uncharacterized SDCCAG3 family protein-like [Tarenaya hassleriana]